MKQTARMLVRAMFGPQHRIHAELGPVGRTANLLDNQIKFGVRQSHVTPRFGINNLLAAQLHSHTSCTRPEAANVSTMEAKINRPSSLPRIASAARSGWAIMPRTLRRALHTPAM